MSIQIIISEEEILGTPNNSELGEKVRNILWESQNKLSFEDEHFRLDIAPDGSVKRIIKPWICSVCGEDTNKIESDYLVGYDHLSCIIQDELDKCVICGKTSPYHKDTHINQRVGYVEGAGQSCWQPENCGKK